jgi:predicted RNA binding protein YcfA (HicA-like mRNA interferase family)
VRGKLALFRDGFFLRTPRKGRHQRFQHLDGRRATVSFHKLSDTFPPKNLKTIIETIIESQAHWTEDDLKRLDLLH